MHSVGAWLIGWFFVLLVLGSWVYVIGHQLGFGAFDPVRYEILRGVLPLAYTVSGLSVCMVGAAIVGTVMEGRGGK